MPSLARGLVVVVLLAIASVVAGACSSVPIPELVDPGRPLVTIEWRGGLCPEGECVRRLEVAGDGTVTDSDSDETFRLRPDVTAGLAAAIAGADFDRIRAVPFQGTCPTAFDGQEATYTFDVRGQRIRIRSCEVAIDPAASPWRELTEALFGG